MCGGLFNFIGKLGAALALITAASLAAATELPRVIHGAAPTTLVGEPVIVDGPLLQIEVAPGVVLSATTGTVLVLTPARENDDAIAVTVITGQTLALNMNREEIRRLGVGTHLIGNNLSPRNAGQAAKGGDPWAAPIESMPGYDALSSELRQGLLLGDGLMVRQQQYLDKLKVDVTAFNRVVVSIIRSLFPRP
jgi:hypothetical protein